jgi:hypothetical protein
MTNDKTREVIIRKNSHYIYNLDVPDYLKEFVTVSKCGPILEEYAELRAAAFVEWIISNEHQYNDVAEEWEFYDQNEAGNYGLKFLCKTTAELYQLFIQSETNQP